jgi:hypothetical protein
VKSPTFDIDLHTSPESIKQAVFEEQVALAYRLTPPTLAASLAPSIITWIILHFITPGLVLNLWIIGILVITLGRFGMVRIYRSSTNASDHPAIWARWYFIGSLSTGLLWGVVGTVLFPVEYPIYQGIMVGILVGVAAGGISSL